MTRTLSTAEARGRFAEVLDAAEHYHERVMITRNGKPVAAVISIEDLELLQALEDQVDQEAAAKAIAESEEQGYVAWRDRKARTRE